MSTIHDPSEQLNDTVDYGCLDLDAYLLVDGPFWEDGGEKKIGGR
jgi:hypothetical protein